MTTARHSINAASVWDRVRSGVGYHLDNLGRWLIVNAPAIGSSYAAFLAPGVPRLRPRPGWVFAEEYYEQRRWLACRRGALWEAAREKDLAPAPERIRPARRCFPGDTPLSPVRPATAVLDRAGDRFQAGDYDGALDCADEVLHETPDSVEAHHSRAMALAQLGRLADARDAITRALALDPDDPETLAAAADMYVNRLPPSTQYTEIGLVYAERAARRHRGWRARWSHASRSTRSSPRARS